MKSTWQRAASLSASVHANRAKRLKIHEVFSLQPLTKHTQQTAIVSVFRGHKLYCGRISGNPAPEGHELGFAVQTTEFLYSPVADQNK
jgi:hypothetical protein